MKKVYNLLLVAMLACFSGYAWADELTVADGTVTNEYSPFYGYYADTKDMQCQTLYLKEDLADLAGGTISALKFYSSNENVSWAADGTEFEVSLAEVDETDFSNGTISPEFISVYTGLLAIENYEMNIAFTENFPYSGDKNLLLEIKVNVKGAYAHGYFYGVSPDEQMSITAYPGWTGTQIQKSYFTPKTTFVYGTQAVTCPRPSKLSAAVTPDGAVFGWQGEESAQFQCAVVEKDGTPEAWELLEANVYTFTAKGLKAGTTYDFYVRTYCSESEQSSAAKVSFTPECKAPEKVEVSDLTHEAATLSWSEVVGIEKYQFVCVLSNATPDWTGIEPKATLSTSVDGLQANTSYTFYVRSWFNEETQSEVAKLTFTTNCVAEELPYSEDFSDEDKLGCWTLGSKWTIDNSNEDHTTGGSTGFLRYNAGSTSDAVSATIELSDAVNLKFYYRNRYSSSAIPFDVIIIDASKNAALLTESITTASSGENWAEKEIDLSAFLGKNIKIKFQGTSNSKGYLRIDDISLTYKSCPAPKNVVAEATKDGANVSWESEEGVSWDLRYRVKDAEPTAEWIVVEGLTEKSKTLEGLAEGTTYEVQVRAIASESRVSEWSKSAEFTPIACASVTEVRFSTGTYNSVMVHWTTSGAGIWELRYKAEDGEWTTEKELAETQHTIIGLTTNKAYTIAVKAACGDEDSWVAAEKTFTPVYSAPVAGEAESISDQGATVQWLGASDANIYEYDFVIPGESATWKESTELSATASDLLAGTEYLFVVRTKYPTGESEADTTAFATITIAPKNLAQDGASTTTSATFKWEKDGAADQWQWRVDAGEWSEAQGELTATAENLTAGAAHTFYVRSFYSESVQSAAISLAFQTACAEKEVGFLESLESGIPTCWESTGSWVSTTEYFRRGNALRINARNASGSLTTPTIHIDTEKAVLIFFERNQYGGNNDYVNAQVIITPEGEEATVVQFANASELKKQVVDLAEFNGKRVTIQFSIPNTSASSNAWVYLDEIQVVEVCEAPEDLKVSPESIKAILTWTASGESDVRYKATSATEWLTIEDAKSPQEVSDLESSTEYEVQVRSLCSEDNVSDWSASVVFSTNESTGLWDVEAGSRASKRIENGVLIIENNGVIYNAQGTKVQ